MEIVVLPSGEAKCIYQEAIPLSELGQISITRASHVEPNDDGQWLADLAPVDGPSLGPFSKRTDALAAEVDWLQNNWLLKSKSS